MLNNINIYIYIYIYIYIIKNKNKNKSSWTHVSRNKERPLALAKYKPTGKCPGFCSSDETYGTLQQVDALQRDFQLLA